VQASRPQRRCVVCGERATVAVPGCDSPMFAGPRWIGYCDAHDPDPREEPRERILELTIGAVSRSRRDVLKARAQAADR